MSSSPLRKFSTVQIEQAVAKALSELAGGEFVVELSNIKFSSSKMNALTGKAEIADLNISAKQKAEPLDINVNFVEPDGTVSGSMHIGPQA
jgi:hypothetical protein